MVKCWSIGGVVESSNGGIVRLVKSCRIFGLWNDGSAELLELSNHRMVELSNLRAVECLDGGMVELVGLSNRRMVELSIRSSSK